MPVPEQRPVTVEQGGADRDAAFGHAVASLGEGDRQASPDQRLADRGPAGDICSGGRVMSTAADCTDTTTVGSEEGHLPSGTFARSATDRVDIQIGIRQDLFGTQIPGCAGLS